ncbi:hypothetical protein [Pectobacterium versatile]
MAEASGNRIGITHANADDDIRVFDVCPDRFVTAATRVGAGKTV